MIAENNTTTLHTAVGEITLLEDGILLFKMTEDKHFTVAQVKIVETACSQLTGGKAAPLLIYPKKLTTPTSDALKYLTSRERVWTPTADAYIIRSLPQRLLGNFYLKLSARYIPTKMFSKKEDAVRWLQNYR